LATVHPSLGVKKIIKNKIKDDSPISWIPKCLRNLEKSHFSFLVNNSVLKRSQRKSFVDYSGFRITHRIGESPFKLQIHFFPSH
jgi:hypothetical protein